MNSNTNNVLAVLAGIAAGSLIALLMAPDSGKATRKKLAKKAAKLARQAKDKGKEYMDRAGEYAGAVSDDLANSAVRNI